jgi:hypothetical protein
MKDHPGGHRMPGLLEIKKGGNSDVPSLVSSFSKMDSTCHGGNAHGRNDHRLRFSRRQACGNRPRLESAMDVSVVHEPLNLASFLHSVTVLGLW